MFRFAKQPIVPIVVIVALISTANAPAHGSLHELIERTNRRIEANPNDSVALLERAGLLCEHGEFDRALADARLAGRIRPDVPEWLLVAARIELEMGRETAAMEALDRYVELRPLEPTGYARRSEVKDRMNDGNGAMDDARAAIRLERPPSLPSHLRLIDLVRKHGDASATAEAFDHARAALGAVPSLLFENARWLGRIGRREDASKLYAELRAATPALGFTSWTEEAHMWSGHNPDRARSARNHAEHAWSVLASNVKAREPMLRQYQSLRSILP